MVISIRPNIIALKQQLKTKTGQTSVCVFTECRSCDMNYLTCKIKFSVSGQHKNSFLLSLIFVFVTVFLVRLAVFNDY